ncbi:MAG: chromosomal replication initiator protein DnaA [Candidatus Krumholzibacteria bacterium]|nr:chromosomal replication initiator protein DnaA [Candidatus Krumholzibacteria bacterium]
MLGHMKGLVNEQCFQTWISPMRPVSFEGGILRIEGRNPFFVDWVHEHHMDKIEKVAWEMLEKETKIELTSRPGPPRVSPPEKSPGRSMIIREPVALPNKIHLNGRYTFDEFIVGNCNRLAHAGALAVAERPAQAYNPLFIYGGSGLGKTHLIQAIGHRIRKDFPGMVISYVSTESFVNELIHAIQKNKTLDFKKKYRNVDILLIDDIQFLAGKEAMQEEFFHTFNALHDANKQIVCTSDRPPKEIHTLEERLRSRFEWGLITDLQTPDVETRIAILRNKIEDENIQIPDNVIEFIAENVTNNIRELEGSLIKILAFASLTCQEITVGMATEALKDIVGAPEEKKITPRRIREAVAADYDLPAESLRAKTRISRVVRARQVAMYLCREMTDLSLVLIGKQFGGRDHSTVLHSIRKIETLTADDPVFAGRVNDIRKKIAG